MLLSAIHAMAYIDFPLALRAEGEAFESHHVQRASFSAAPGLDLGAMANRETRDFQLAA